VTSPLVIPEYLQNDVYLPRKLCERITGVGGRMLQNYAMEGRLDKRYYIQGSKHDLVCYRAYDILKIAHEKNLPWASKIKDTEIASQILSKEETFISRNREAPIIDKTENLSPREAIQTLNQEALMSQIVTPLVTISDTLANMEKLLRNKEKPKNSKLQTYATIACLLVYSCLLYYVLIIKI